MTVLAGDDGHDMWGVVMWFPSRRAAADVIDQLVADLVDRCHDVDLEPIGELILRSGRPEAGYVPVTAWLQLADPLTLRGQIGG